jgi:CDGSH-type Zn-finger protein
VSNIRIRIRDNGPIVIEAPVTISDAEGNPFPIAADKPAVALCRCGASANKPFCDGAHRNSGFESVVRATPG